MKKQTLIQIVFTVITLLFLICTATWFVLSITPIYELLVDLLHIEETSGYSREVIIKNYRILIEYNMFWGPNKLIMPDFPMSYGGEYHFMEVKNIFVGMQFTAIGTAILLIPMWLFAKKHEIYEWLRWSIYAAVMIVVMIGAAVIIDWDGAFVLFHEIVFDNDYWIFDYTTDPVIWILPDSVFLIDASLILVLITAGFAGCEVLYRKKKRNAR